MIPKQAIEKAIEGGWKGGHGAFAKCKNPTETLEMFNFCYPTQESIDQHRHYFEYTLDKTFWQALGKALGWQSTYKTTGGAMRTIGEEDYKEHAHRFYDLILTGGDIEKFWEEILSATKEI